MNPSIASRPCPRWLHARVAATLLITLLQRTPAVRLAQATSEALAASPIAAILKSAIATLAGLGAVHSLAGATALVGSQPSGVTVTQGAAITPIAFTVTDTINLGSWRLAGNLPPGLKLAASQGGAELTGPGVLDATSGGTTTPSDDPYATPGEGGNTMTTPLLSGTPTQPGTYTFTLQAYQLGGLTGFNTVPFNYTINVAAAAQTNTAPAFSTQPAAQTVTAGANVTFTAAASGTPAPSYQWHKGGTAIAGATNASLNLSNVQAGDAGSYTVVATNSAGTVTSTTAALVVLPPAGSAAPAIARQPQAQTIATGSTVVFSTQATGGGLSYQWRRNGANLAGATSTSLVLAAASTADAGTYSVVVSNSAGSATSAAVTLALVNETNFGHLVNLSIRTTITTADPSFTVGTVVGGATGTKPMLVRAVGPALVGFGLSSAISDSRLDVRAGSAIIASNDNWGTGGEAALATAFTAVGAFPLASGSRDAALYSQNFEASAYTIDVSGVGGATGDVLAELYDATASGSFNASVPRLVNVSVRKQIDAGTNLTAGFVIGGNTARTVLVRAIGPGLAAFGVSGTLADPQLMLFSGETRIAENDNWGGDPQLTNTGSAVGAFALANASSRDAMLLITLAPGGYTAQVSGVAGTGGGSALIEVYEVP